MDLEQKNQNKRRLSFIYFGINGFIPSNKTPNIIL